MALSPEEQQELNQLEGLVQRAQSQQQNQQPAAPEQGTMGKVWSAMNKPSEMAQDGLQQMTGLQTDAQNAIAQKTGLPIGTEPTGNMVRDVAANIPRIAGETMAEVAPKFIDNVSMATAGLGAAAKGAGMVAGKVLPKIAPMLERGSGLRAGTLNAAYQDPSIIADFGAKAKASALYEALKDGSDLPVKLRTNAGLVRSALDDMAAGNTLDARDAFKARKAVKALLDTKDSASSFPKDDLYKIKDQLDNMVFSSTKQADKLYQRAIQGESMRNVARLNKNGTTGPVGQAALAMLPSWAKALGSPIIQGGGASLAGAAAQMGPEAAVGAGGAVGGLIEQGFDRLRKRKKG